MAQEYTYADKATAYHEISERLAEITEDQWDAAIEAVVAEAGEDYVYPDDKRVIPPGERDVPQSEGLCLYGWEDEEGNVTGGCIVGRVIDKIDHDLLVKVHEVAEGQGTWGIFGFDLGATSPGRALGAAQGAQDTGDTFGQALTSYRTVRTGDTFA